MAGSLRIWDLNFCQSTRCLTIMRGPTVIYNADLATSLNHFQDIHPVIKSVQASNDAFQVEWPGVANLAIKKKNAKGLQCYNIEWRPLCGDFIPVDVIHLSGVHWYGGGQLYEQKWPSSQQSIKMRHYLVEDFFHNGGGWGNIAEPFWISSEGVGIYIDHNVPLHVSLNENNNDKIELKADFNMSKYKNTDNSYPMLSYDVCVAPNTKDLWMSMYPIYFKKPESIPDPRMFSAPIWSTWAKYKVHVDEKKVLEYADDIQKHGFPNSQLEIDDMYTSSYGEMDFDTKKFPNAKEMVQKLHNMGFRVTSWTHPFVNYESPVYDEGKRNGFFILDGNGKEPAKIEWWQGTGAVVDVTNADACEWFTKRLEKFQKEYNMDSFKFDAGETNWLPDLMTTSTPLKTPNDFTTKYVEVVSKFGGMIEVRCGYASQRHPIFVRMLDKDSIWGYENGLKSMIPTALVMGIVGYPFVLPDMIGGNGYPENGLSGGLQGTILPSKELFIRWAQLSAYLPSMQFSICPWQYDDETIAISKQAVIEHETIVTPMIIELAWESVKTGAPIIRPLWWIDCKDQTCFSIDSEFLIGDSFLVAPILEEGARSRDIYLPRGSWRDNLKKQTVQGGQWLKAYKIGLDQIATFKKIS